jgi:hypothetical protein
MTETVDHVNRPRSAFGVARFRSALARQLDLVRLARIVDE